MTFASCPFFLALFVTTAGVLIDEDISPQVFATVTPKRLGNLVGFVIRRRLLHLYIPTSLSGFHFSRKIRIESRLYIFLLVFGATFVLSVFVIIILLLLAQIRSILTSRDGKSLRLRSF